MKNSSCLFQRKIENYDVSGVTAEDHSRTWITFTEPTFTISEFQLENAAHVALEPNPSAHELHELITDTMSNEGFVQDKKLLGRIHVGPNQKMKIRYVLSLFDPRKFFMIFCRLRIIFFKIELF